MVWLSRLIIIEIMNQSSITIYGLTIGIGILSISDGRKVSE